MSAQLPEILVVDDSSTIRASMKKFLGENYTVHVAEDGSKGWEALQRNENIKVVFADMHMPVLNGLQLLQCIRQSEYDHIANVPVVMITGEDDTRPAKRAAHTIGASDFIGKPFKKDEILAVADSFSRLDRRTNEISSDECRRNMAELENSRRLLDFGNKAIHSSHEMKTDTAVLYAEIAEVDALNEKYGSKITEQITGKIKQLLEVNVRQEEMMEQVNTGSFVVVLPMTKAFKAHIVASRLRKAAHSIEFDNGSERIRVNLAVGVTATDADDNCKLLEFKDYVMQARLSMRMSKLSKNYPVTRYDETFDEHFENLPEMLEVKPAERDTTDLSLDEYGEYFSGIMMGDYSRIPESYLPMFIEPIERFLKHAKSLSKSDDKSEVA